MSNKQVVPDKPTPDRRVAFHATAAGKGLLQRWAAQDAAGVEHVVEIFYQTAGPQGGADN